MTMETVQLTEQMRHRVTQALSTLRARCSVEKPLNQGEKTREQGQLDEASLSGNTAQVSNG